ncbi:MAG: hypothetical protein EA402_13160 [Planctomycetota bacterium]|nr:MAG: hypothetical protein EA402_13160 [Planctomycetota bacterium]
MFMRVLRWIVVVVAIWLHLGASERESPAHLLLDGVPPSPSSHPGERLWPDPHFSHWPALAYFDEDRNAALSLPLRQPGQAGAWGWQDQPAIPFRLPQNPQLNRSSGLLGLPREIGDHRARISIAEGHWELPLRMVPVSAARWPHARLRQGFPVDADDVPVVLRLQRDYGQGDRRWLSLRRRLPLGEGPAVFIGDPLEALGRDVVPAYPGLLRQLSDEPFPAHAALVAWAQVAAQRPSRLIWSPGNASIEQHRWTEEELRLIEALNQAAAAQGYRFEGVLLVPPLPVESRLQEIAKQRRVALRYHASRHGWEVVDGESIAGQQGAGARLQPGLYTRYPHGQAQDRLRQALEP